MQADTTLAPTEREQFEAWMKEGLWPYSCRRISDADGGAYANSAVQDAWNAWQERARRAQAAPQGPALVPLTDAKLVACIERAGFKTWDSRMWVLKRAIEAAHGITGAPDGN